MILIIDDDQAVRMSLSLLFKQAGFDSEAVGNAADAIEVVRNREPQLVMLDMNLSLSTTGRDGIELLRKIKVFCPDTPVILISAWGTIALAVEGMAHGAADFVTKPWSNRDLMAKVRKVIGSKNTPAAPPTLEEMERQAIIDALRRNNYNQSLAADELGITRQSLYRRISKYGIPV
ncbi:MAG: DNA-binding response regulator [Paramuribaculum sp.]|nr:DNA-binding response regulator [Paramuribaculum sp.]